MSGLRQVIMPLARAGRVINTEVVAQGSARLPNLAVREFRATPLARGGGVGPIEYAKPPAEPLPEEHELIWDDGSMTPEICLKDWAPTVTPNHALAGLTMGLGFFVGLYQLASWTDKAATCPFVAKEFPYDNLAVEMGRKSA